MYDVAGQFQGKARVWPNPMTSTTATTMAPLNFDTQHEDIIHDAQMDYYGKRLATASSDRTIRLFAVEPNQREQFLASLIGHEGPVWQVSWAHPEFGSLLASCSYDGAVFIWKESSNGQWAKIKEHRVHDSSVNSIAWAPPELGLILACASADGKISILAYDATSQNWGHQLFQAHQVGCTSVSWQPAIMSGSLLFPVSSASEPRALVKRLATGGCDNLVKLWKVDNATGEWTQEGAPLAGHSDWVRDVAFSPSAASLVPLLATCSQDRTVLLWRETSPGVWSKSALSAEPFADTLWRLSWSVAGNLLAVSSGDNHVSIWRENAEGVWEQTADLDQGSIAPK